MTDPDRGSPLDSPAARLVAVAIALAGMAFLGWIHRNDLFPPELGAAPANPAEAGDRNRGSRWEARGQAGHLRLVCGREVQISRELSDDLLVDAEFDEG